MQGKHIIETVLKSEALKKMLLEMIMDPKIIVLKSDTIYNFIFKKNTTSLIVNYNLETITFSSKTATNQMSCFLIYICSQ